MPFSNIKSVLNRSTSEGNFNLPLAQGLYTLDSNENKKYTPYTVNRVIDSNVLNVSDLSDHISLNELAVLVYQDNNTQNGIYKQTGATTAVKQDDPATDSHFLDIYNDNPKQAVYLENTGSYRLVDFNRVIYGKDFGTSTSEDTSLFETILIPKEKPGLIDLQVFGVSGTNTFYGQYQRQYYNSDGGTTYLDNGEMTSIVKTSGTFTEPTITFNNPPSINLDTNIENGVSWYTRAEIIF